MGSEEMLVLQKIYNQFISETKTINEYIDFMEKSVVLNGLKDNGNNHYSYSLEVGDIKSIQTKIEILSEKNLEDISVVKNRIEKSELYELPSWFKSIDARSEEGELVDFIFEQIESEITDRDVIFQNVYTELEAECIIKGENIGGDFYIGLYDNKEKIYEYIDYSLKAYHNNLVMKDKQRLEALKNYEKLLRLIDVKNNINIYRQAFIQLVALFDALVFECFKIHFNKNFFKWLKLFDKENISLHEIANNDSFDDLKNMIIEKKLKNLYLKDLLVILNENNTLLFFIDGEIKYANFREIINRRNCHIHNNGNIDKAYLGIDKNGTSPVFNIYNFTIGDYAEINKEYLNVAIKYCSEFIKNLTQT